MTDKVNKLTVKRDSPAAFEGKLPPQAIDLEESVLGAIMLDRDAMDVVANILVPDSFYKNENGMIYSVMNEMYQNNKQIDLLTVTSELRKCGKLELIGGAYYITLLTTRLTSAANVEAHARIVQEKYMQRRLIQIANDILKKAYDNTADVFELIEYADSQIFNLTNNIADSKTELLPDAFVKLIDEIVDFNPATDTVGTPTGFPGLDKIISMLQKTNVYLIAGRPGMGKTSLALNIAEHIGIELQIPCAFFSYEMNTKQLVQKVVSSRYKIPLHKIKDYDKSVVEIMMEQSMYGKMTQSQLIFDDGVNTNILGLRSKVKKLKKLFGIEGIFVDYVQLIPELGGGNSIREIEISRISRGLKLIAKEFDIWVIELSQLNRESEKTNSKPKISQLRESGTLEQDADVIIFPYRPEYFGIQSFEDGSTTDGRAEIIISKNRHGSVDSYINNWYKNFNRFSDENLYEINTNSDIKLDQYLPDDGPIF